MVIFYSTDGGANLQPVPGTDAGLRPTDPVWGAFPWTVPDAPSANGVLLLRGYFGEAPTQSDVFTISAVTDGDLDGMDDGWEAQKFGDTSRDGTGDSDGDGYTDLDEFMGGTDPTDPADMPGPALGGGGGGLISCGGLPVGGRAGVAALALAVMGLVSLARRRERAASPSVKSRMNLSRFPCPSAEPLSNRDSRPRAPTPSKRA